MTERVQKLIAAGGLCSRRTAAISSISAALITAPVGLFG